MLGSNARKINNLGVYISVFICMDERDVAIETERYRVAVAAYRVDRPRRWLARYGEYTLKGVRASDELKELLTLYGAIRKEALANSAITPWRGF